MGSIDFIIGNELAFRPFPGNQQGGAWGPTLITLSSTKYAPKAPPPQTTNMRIGAFSFHHGNFLAGGPTNHSSSRFPAMMTVNEHHMSKKLHLHGIKRSSFEDFPNRAANYALSDS